MARVLITGSSDGLGLMAARLLVDEGHEVTLHARSDRRAADARATGWVPTKMGGCGAPDDLSLAPVTQTWLATSDDVAALVSGRHFYHRRARGLPDEVHVSRLQDALLDYCAALTGVTIADERRQPQGR